MWRSGLPRLDGGEASRFQSLLHALLVNLACVAELHDACDDLLGLPLLSEIVLLSYAKGELVLEPHLEDLLLPFGNFFF